MGPDFYQLGIAHFWDHPHIPCIDVSKRIRKTMTPAQKTQSEIRLNADVLTTTLELKDARVVDIGCGDGSLVRLMARHGARVFGVDNSDLQLAKARAAKPAGNEVYYDGRAEALPFDDACIDVAMFFNSLHHVPAKNMTAALIEAVRVLKPGGILYVSEPLAFGPHFDLMQPVHDETQVRAEAQKAIAGAETLGLKRINEIRHTHPVHLDDFDAFRERMLRINPDQADAFGKMEKKLQDAFATLAKPGEKGFVFDQPMRVDIFEKA